MKNKKTKENKAIKAIIAPVIASVMSTAVSFAVYADDGLSTTLTNTNNLIFSIIRLIGIGCIAFAVYELGISFVNHDGSARWRGIGALAGGLIIVFAKEILTTIGVSMT